MSSLEKARTNGSHATATAGDPSRFLDGSVVPLGAIEPPRSDEVTTRLATVLRVLTRATAEACNVDRCSVFVPRGDVLQPVMAQFAGGTSAHELWEVVRRITREAAQAVRADSAGIYLMTENRDRLLPYAAYHMPKEILDTIRRRPIILKHFQDLQMHWSGDVPNDPAFQAPIFRQFPAKSLILAPLRAKDGVIGVLACAWWTRRHRVTREEITLVESLAGPAAVAIENARLYAKAAQAAVDQERVRVDRILHDTLRHTVFSMAMKIEMALMGSNKASALRAALRGLKQDAAVMMAQMREVVPPGDVIKLSRAVKRR